MISSSHRLSSRLQQVFVAVLSAALLCALMIASGCSGMMGNMLMSPGQTTAFAFVSNSGSGTVSAFAISSTGSFSAVPGSPFPAGGGAEFMAFDRVHNLLFVSNQSANTLSEFSVNTSTGTLSPVAGSPVATGTRPTAVAVDGAGRFVLLANQGSNSIAVFSIGASGALAAVPGSPFPAASPFGLSLNPAGTVLYASN